MDDQDRTNQASQSHEHAAENTSELTDPSAADQRHRNDRSSSTPDPREGPTADQGSGGDSGVTRRATPESSGDQDSGGHLSTAPGPPSAGRDTTHGIQITARQKPAVLVAGGLSAAVILSAALWVVVVQPDIEIQPADGIALALGALSIIWSVSAFFLSRSTSREQQERDHEFQLARETRDAERTRRQEERQEGRERRREARATEREERRAQRAKERARGEIAATIATHVVDINAHLAKIDVLAKPLPGDDGMTDDVRFIIRCPEEVRQIVSIEYR